MDAVTVPENALIVPKNASECLVMRETEYQGVKLLDARVWTKYADGSPDVPTKKGLCLRPAVWRQLLPMIDATLQEIAPGASGE